MTNCQEKTDHAALFGGTFDPPHIGHLAFCRELVEDDDFESVWVIPAFQHPFSKRMAPFNERLAMCRIAFEPLGEKIEIKNDEADAGGSGFTIDLIGYLIKRYPNYRFTLALGSDNYQQRHQWKRFEEIERLVGIRFFGRKGWERENEDLGVPAPFPQVSSTEIRQLIAGGKVPEDLLPPGVSDYILERGLYRLYEE